MRAAPIKPPSGPAAIGSRLRALAPEAAFGAAVFVFLMLHPALNGYPFLFPDSWGYYGACPDEMRSPVLGCTFKPFTWCFGPWGYAVVQTAAAALALAFLWGRVLERRHTSAFALALALSGFGLFTGWLMADCWTLIGLVGLFAMAAGRGGAVACGLLAFGAAAHFGNLPIFAATALPTTLFARRKLRFLASAAVCLTAALGLIAGFNLIGGTLKLTSGNGSLFLASRILHDLPQVLERRCAEDPGFAFCARKDEILAWSTADHQSFTWTAVYNLGLSWGELERLSRRLVAGSLSAGSGFLWGHTAAAVRNTVRLMLLPEVANGFEPFDKDSFAVADLRECHPGDVDDYLGSWQSQGGLQRFLRAAERPVRFLLWGALAVCLIGVWRGFGGLRRGDVLVQLACFALAAGLANAFTMSLLSGVFGRYQTRLLFLAFLPAAALACEAALRRLRKPA